LLACFNLASLLIYTPLMDTTTLILELDLKIARLQQVKDILTEAPAKAKPGPKPKGSKPTTSFDYGSNKAPQKRSTMSPEGRARIAAAQKARWAKAKKK
jgi:hypothetical protein